jgi:DnaJ-class molecular chaperone
MYMCAYCAGKGYIEWEHDGPGSHKDSMTCDECDGTGKVSK